MRVALPLLSQGYHQRLFGRKSRVCNVPCPGECIKAQKKIRRKLYKPLLHTLAHSSNPCLHEVECLAHPCKNSEAVALLSHKRKLLASVIS